MKVTTWIAATAALCISSSLYASDSNGVIVSHFEPLQRLSIAGAGTDNVSGQKAGAAQQVMLSFDALGKTFEMQLEPNSALIAAAPRDALADDVKIYRGHLAGKPESWVRVVVHEGMPSGLVWDGEQMYALEAPGESALQINSPVIYRLADVFITPGSMSCGTVTATGNGAATFQTLMTEIAGAIAQGPGAVEELTVGAVGDFEFTNARGSDSAAAAAITTRLNNVDGIFSQQLGVQLTIQTMDTFSDAADPFSDTIDPGTLLGEVADYRQATASQNSQGITHLYTGRTLNGSTVGIAYSAALCHPRFGAGLSEGNNNAMFDSLVAAHEIGHNFGAPHDGEVGSACEAETGNFIMAASLNGSNQFSSCSITQMQDDIAGASCINALPAVDVAVSLNGQASTLLLGANTVLSYAVPNNGTLEATGVTADFTLPSTLTFGSVATTIGTCTSGAGTVSCDLGTVPGSSNQSVTITASPSSIGVGMLTASVTADVDDRLSNNQETIQVTVDPAVDLVVSLPAQVTIDIDQSTTVTAALENRSVLDATGVTLDIGISGGLRIDSATWSLGSCNIVGQQVDCQASTFSAQSAATLSLGLTGISSGSKNYTVTASSNEADAVMGDNTDASSVRVREEKDEGGGASGPMFFLLLTLVTLLTRGRTRGRGSR